MDNTKLLETIVGHLIDLRQDMSGVKQEIGGIKQDIVGLKQEVSGIKQDISGLKQEVSGVKQDISGLKQEVSGLKQDMAAMNKRMDGLEKNQHDLQATVARIEVDHGNKLTALLDGYHHNAESLERVEIRLERVEAKIESHDIQISVLDRTKTNRRKAK